VRWMQPRVERLRVVYLERLPLGTRYFEVARRVRELMGRTAGARRCEVVADATGVGLPVVEILRTAGIAATIVPVTITSGGEARRGTAAWHVPRRDLLGKLAVELEQGRLAARGVAAGGVAAGGDCGVQAGSGRGGEGAWEVILSGEMDADHTGFVR
jgi:hypothetical protein